MLPNRRNNFLLCAISAVTLIATCPALAQTVIDSGDVQVPSTPYPSPWSPPGTTLTIGQTGTATLTVSAGGKVNTVTAILGRFAGSNGTATITGFGSKWESAIGLTVGAGGKGILTIDHDATALIGQLFIGDEQGSNGRVTISNGATLIAVSHLSVGGAGTGTLTIAERGKVTAGIVYIGTNGAANGTLQVEGTGSELNILTSGGYNDLNVGYFGTGTLMISAGGRVTNNHGFIGEGAGGTGSATVSGAGSQWNNMGDLIVGNLGNGSLTIEAGGVVSSTRGSIGDTGSGTVLVTGPGSQWATSGNLFLGFSGSGTLTIANGGTVSNGTGYIALSPNSSGAATVSGAGSQWISSSGLTVGVFGAGTLAIADQGNITAPNIVLAENPGSTGILAVGALAGRQAVAPGTVATEAISFGNGDGTIVFNHTSSNYVFDTAITDGISGTGEILAIAGRTILNRDHIDFTGNLQISGAGILQINGDMTGAAANVLAGGRLEGNGFVGATTNAGVIAPGASIGTLTIAGNYTGLGGALEIEAVLGGDNSPTDKLVITGDVSGSSNVKVTNLGGAGAQTNNGIQIISIAGLSPSDAFVLSGDYVTTDGQQAVIGGAYAYTLQHGGTNTTTDGQWYLTSQLRPVVVDDDVVEPKGGGLRYQPGVPVYEQYGQVLASLNTLPTLQERVGNRYWSSQPGSTSGNYGMWGRVEGQRMAANPARSTTSAHRDIDLWKLQTGFDFVLNQSASGVLIGGVNVSHGTALAEIGSPFGRGKIDTRGTGIGATLTWYGESGLYVDAQAQAMWFDSDITSTTLGRKLAKGNKGNGYALSVETGNRFLLSNGFSVTPQVQLTWSRVDFKSFTDPFGTYVSSQNGDSLRMRLGVSLDHEASWITADGTKSRTHLYGIANLYNEFLKGSKVSVAHIPFRSRDERLWAGLGLGATYEWNDGRYAIFGTANLAGSLEHMSRNYNLGGTLGFRMAW